MGLADVAGVVRMRAAAVRLAALGLDLEQRAGSEVADHRQFVAQFVSPPFEPINVRRSMGHGARALNKLVVHSS